MSPKRKTKRKQKSKANYFKQSKKSASMPQKVSNVFRSAVEYHQAGQIQVAEQLYRQVLTGNPGFADAHGNLGGGASGAGPFRGSSGL